MTQVSLSTWEIHKHVYEVLKNDSVLGDIVVGVFDGQARDETNMPYIVIDSWNERQNDALTRHGRELTANVNIWSDYEGLREVGIIGDRVNLLLHRQAFATDSWHCYDVQFNDAQELTEPTGARHLILRFMFKVVHR